MISQGSKNGLRNPWLLGIIVAIAVVFMVNGTFIWFAAHNRPALVGMDYNTKDRKTNAAVIRELQEQKSLAWKTTIKRPRSVVTGQPAGYEIGVTDRDGAPVTGAVEVEAYRASDGSKDFRTTFPELSPGSYQGYISFPLKGYWELRIRIRRGNETFEVSTDRFMVAAAS